MTHGEQRDEHSDYSCRKCAKTIHKISGFHELVFHPQFGGVAVVVRPSGENFPSPFNQFQSIGQKKFQIPIPRATYVHNLSFVPILRQLNESLTFCILEKVTVLM